MFGNCSGSQTKLYFVAGILHFHEALGRLFLLSTQQHPCPLLNTQQPPPTVPPGFSFFETTFPRFPSQQALCWIWLVGATLTQLRSHRERNAMSHRGSCGQGVGFGRWQTQGCLVSRPSPENHLWCCMPQIISSDFPVILALLDFLMSGTIFLDL